MDNVINVTDNEIAYSILNSMFENASNQSVETGDAPKFDEMKADEVMELIGSLLN